MTSTIETAELIPLPEDPPALADADAELAAEILRSLDMTGASERLLGEFQILDPSIERVAFLPPVEASATGPALGGTIETRLHFRNHDAEAVAQAADHQRGEMADQERQLAAVEAALLASPPAQAVFSAGKKVKDAQARIAMLQGRVAALDDAAAKLLAQNKNTSDCRREAWPIREDVADLERQLAGMFADLEDRKAALARLRVVVMIGAIDWLRRQAFQTKADGEEELKAAVTGPTVKIATARRQIIDLDLLKARLNSRA